MTPNDQYTFYASIGARIRQARERAGLSQHIVAARLGVTPTAVSYWENAVHRPSLWNWERLRRVLGADL